MLTFRLDRPMLDSTARDVTKIPADALVVAVLDEDARREERKGLPKMFKDGVMDEAAIQAHREAEAVLADRNDFRTWEAASQIAESANKLGNGESYIATDAGAHTSPRYDVIAMFKVGEPVSYSFNGDSYPDGEIVSIGTGRMAWIKTSTGARYHRQGLTGRWRKQGGTWTLIHGHVDERNPHF